MSTRRSPRLQGQNGTARRTIDPEALREERDRLMQHPMSPERTKALRRVRNSLRNLEFRNPRYER